MEYDIIMVWKAGVEHVLPDALSRLPHSPEPQEDVDDSFPDDATSRAKSDYVGPQGPTLDGFRLVDLATTSPDEDEPVTVAKKANAHVAASLQSMPFATCATLEPPLSRPRRSTRTRAPSVRLTAPG
ncbi:unnamed protein product, partial [Scytosiphon promiscuus]